MVLSLSIYLKKGNIWKEFLFDMHMLHNDCREGFLRP